MYKSIAVEKVSIWDHFCENSSLQEFFHLKVLNKHASFAYSILYLLHKINNYFYLICNKALKTHFFSSIQRHKTNWYICKSSRIIPEMFLLVRPWYVISLGGLQRIEGLFQSWPASREVAKCWRKWVSTLLQLDEIRPRHCLIEFKFSWSSCFSGSHEHQDRWY